MKFYSTLVQEEKNEVSDLVVLHDSFCWNAFLFGPLWFLYHKMWLEFAIASAFGVLIGSLPLLSSFDKIALQTAFAIIIAINANYWLQDHLQKKKNYRFLGVVIGKNDMEAKVRFFEQQ